MMNNQYSRLSVSDSADDLNTSEGHNSGHGADTVGPIEPDIGRFPYCLVWTPLPIITWFVPVIGHTGIASSTGVIRDFAGSFNVGEDDMAFGSPTRYVQLDPAKVRSLTYTYNESIRSISTDFNQKEHNIFLQNCHSHVACCLNRMLYEGRDDWNMFKVALLFVRQGRFVGRAEMISTLAPFVIVLGVMVFLGAFIFAMGSL